VPAGDNSAGMEGGEKREKFYTLKCENPEGNDNLGAFSPREERLEGSNLYCNWEFENDTKGNQGIGVRNKTNPGPVSVFVRIKPYGGTGGGGNWAYNNDKGLSTRIGKTTERQ